jgi:hypothetical protein
MSRMCAGFAFQASMCYVGRLERCASSKGTIPIGGASKISQIEDSLAALGWTPAEKEMQLLNEVSITELGFPHDFLESKESILG